MHRRRRVCERRPCQGLQESQSQSGAEASNQPPEYPLLGLPPYKFFLTYSYPTYTHPYTSPPTVHVSLYIPSWHTYPYLALAPNKLIPTYSWPYRCIPMYPYPTYISTYSCMHTHVSTALNIPTHTQAIPSLSPPTTNTCRTVCVIHF